MLVGFIHKGSDIDFLKAVTLMTAQKHTYSYAYYDTVVPAYSVPIGIGRFWAN